MPFHIKEIIFHTEQYVLNDDTHNIQKKAIRCIA